MNPNEINCLNFPSQKNCYRSCMVEFQKKSFFGFRFLSAGKHLLLMTGS
jgi:hypothetical protein